MTSGGPAQVLLPRACPVCAQTDGEHGSTSSGSHSTTVPITGYQVVVCGRCGAVYADGIPSQEVLDAYYRESSKYEYLDQDGEQPDWQLRWHEEAAGSLVRFIPHAGARIVDIGCANADLLGMLRERGYSDVLGVDPAPGSAVAAARLHGVRVLEGDVFSLPSEAEGADLVILSAVLEHLRDVDQALHAVVGTLAPSGALYVEVPDLERFPQHVEPPFQQFSLEHVNYFTAGSLMNAASRAGLEYVELWHETRRVGPTWEPSVCAVFRRAPGSLQTIAHDPTGLRAVLEYVAASLDRERKVHDRIRGLVDSRVPFILWGVGTHALHLLATTALRGVEIVGLVDANPRSCMGCACAGRSSPVRRPWRAGLSRC